jgi:hypothetical protein
MAKRE